ncbi:MAG: hypothetical protein L6R40_003583 [Gallowayella cf. fulva]|nr:MAG: hypothetical protein L6R40_003583 [Xanthomendoza cf. fulva]
MAPSRKDNPKKPLKKPSKDTLEDTSGNRFQPLVKDATTDELTGRLGQVGFLPAGLKRPAPSPPPGQPKPQLAKIGGTREQIIAMLDARLVELERPQNAQQVGTAVQDQDPAPAQSPSLEQPKPQLARLGDSREQLQAIALARLAELRAPKKAAPGATATQDQGPAPAQSSADPQGMGIPQSSTDAMHTTPMNPPLPLKGKRAKAGWEFCAFGWLPKAASGEVSWVGPSDILLHGKIGPQAPQWGLSVKVNAGNPGLPCLAIRIDVALIPRKEGYLKAVSHEEAKLQWQILPTSASQSRVETFQYQPFTEWIENASPELKALEQIVEANRSEYRNLVWVISCEVAKGDFKDFSSPKCWTACTRELETLIQLLRVDEPRNIVILFIPKNSNVRDLHLPQFQRYVNEQKAP